MNGTESAAIQPWLDRGEYPANAKPLTDGRLDDLLEIAYGYRVKDVRRAIDSHDMDKAIEALRTALDEIARLRQGGLP